MSIDNELMEVNKTLKTCPFCNGKSRVHKYLNKFYARCNKCNSYSAPYDTPEQAAEAWNRRVRIDEQLTIKAEPEPCTFCVYNPPSSSDGKPCTICPAHKRSDEE